MCIRDSFCICILLALVLVAAAAPLLLFNAWEPWRVRTTAGLGSSPVSSSRLGNHDLRGKHVHVRQEHRGTNSICGAQKQPKNPRHTDSKVHYEFHSGLRKTAAHDMRGRSVIPFSTHQPCGSCSYVPYIADRMARSVRCSSSTE